MQRFKHLNHFSGFPQSSLWFLSSEFHIKHFKTIIRRTSNSCYWNRFSSSSFKGKTTIQKTPYLPPTQIFDQYLNFITLEKDLFTFAQNNSFFGFNDPQITDSDAEKNIDSVVDSLFSVLVTMVI